MIWTTWRQHRAEAGVGALILVALAAAMLIVGNIARERARALGVPACISGNGDCSNALGRLHDDFHSIPPFTFALIALPLVAGMFWAAPLVSREYEAGTHRLAWTQSISPLRWITVKIALIFTVVAAAALLLGLLATWTLNPLTPAFGGRYNSSWYDIQGIVPVACMLFALAVGVAASTLIRRTIPAMAVTLVTYAAARIPIHWIRWHFAPLSTHTLTVPLTTLLDNITGSPRDYASTTALPTDAWLHGLTATGPAGTMISPNENNFSVLRQYCPNLQVNPTRDGVLNPAACAAHIRNLSLQETIRYQPRTHFWLIQAVESAIFVGLAALLIFAAVFAVARRRPT
jgi:ABC-type transport system involved in multi-copper enzyme maturation permease subunit